MFFRTLFGLFIARHIGDHKINWFHNLIWDIGTLWSRCDTCSSKFMNFVLTILNTFAADVFKLRITSSSKLARSAPLCFFDIIFGPASSITGCLCFDLRVTSSLYVYPSYLLYSYLFTQVLCFRYLLVYPTIY